MRTMFSMLAGAALAAGLGLALATPAFAEDAKVDKKIERLWKSKCASCHGVDGKGQTDQGKKMKVADYASPAWQKGITDEKIKHAIVTGVKKEEGGVKKEMDAFADLTPEQLDGLVALIRSLK